MTSTPTPELPIGDRVRFFRRRKGISQAALGGLIGRSEDWVSKVERGLIPVDRVTVLLELARVLGVRELSDLTGRAVVALTVDEEPEHDSVPAIRRAFYTQPSRLAADAADVPTAEEIAERSAEAWRIYEYERVRYAVVGPMLPRLLAEAHAAAAADPAASKSLISVYHLLQVFLRRLGERTLSQIAADRSMSLADQLGDPELIAASAWNLCSILTNLGHVEESADLALSTIDRYPLADDAADSHIAAHGALHLAAVIASVRSGTAPRAWDLLRRAGEVADRLGGDSNHWRTSFGPTNVNMHSVHLAAEEGDAAEAIHFADDVRDNEQLPLERRTRYLIEVMHAHRLQRDDMGTLFMAQKIRQLSPEEMRWHPLVRAAVSDLLTRERPTWRAEIRDLASHVGVLSG